MWFIHMIEYCSALKRNETLIHATTWENLENTTLSERRQTPKATYHKTPVICDVQNRQAHRDESCLGLGGIRGTRGDCPRAWGLVSLWSDENAP